MTEIVTTNPIVKDVATINEGLQAFEDTKARFKKLAEEAGKVTKPAVTDKKAIAALRRMRIDLRNEEIEIEKQGKGMRDLVNHIPKSILEKQREVTTIVSPVREKFEKWEEEIDSELAAIKAEEERKENARITGRIGRLMEAGCELKEDVYVYGELTLNTAEVKMLDDQTFDEFVVRVTEKYNADQAAAEEQKRLAALQREREDLIRPYWHLSEWTQAQIEAGENDATFAGLHKLEAEDFGTMLSGLKIKHQAVLDQAAEVQRKADELAEQQRQLEQQKKDLKIQRLTALGLKWDGDQFIGEGVNVHWSDLVIWDDEKFEKEFLSIQDFIIDQKEKKHLFDSRALLLIEAGMLKGNGAFTYPDKITLNFDAVTADSEDEFTARLASIKEIIAGEVERKRLDAEAERKRIADKAIEDEKERQRIVKEKADRKAARQPDKVKILAYFEAIRAVPVPEMKADDAAAFFLQCREKIDESLQVLETKAKEL